MTTRAADFVCPGCGLRTPMEIAVQHEAARQVLAEAIEAHGEYGRALLAYVGLHRPKQRALTWDKLARLVGELLAMRRAGEIVRDGKRHAMTDALWVEGFHAVRDAAGKTLTLPLDGHGYLLAVLASLAERAQSAAEAEAMSRARGETPIGYSPAHAPAPGHAVEAAEGPFVPPPPEVLERLRAFSAGRARRPLTDADRSPRPNKEREPRGVLARIEGEPALVEIVKRETRRGKVRLLVRRLDVDPEIQAMHAENTLLIGPEDLL